MQAMQAALLDSALYVRFLRAKLLALQLSEHRTGSQGALRPDRVVAGLTRRSRALSSSLVLAGSKACGLQSDAMVNCKSLPSVCALAVSCR